MCSMLSSAKAARPPPSRGQALGRLLLVDRAARLRGGEVVTAPVGIERGEQPAPADDLLQAAKARGGALLLDQKDRVDRARRIIEGDNQIERRLARQPLVR